MSILIQQVRLLDPASQTDKEGSLLIRDGKIDTIFLSHEPEQIDEETLRIVATGQYLFPGLVDLATWLREPGFDHKATLASESRAAVASGITSLCYQPEPGAGINNSAQFNLIQDIATRVGLAKVYVMGNMTQQLQGQQLTNMASLAKSGCVGVTNGWQAFENLRIMRYAMEYATTHHLTVFMYPWVHDLAADGCAHEGEVATRLGLPAIPSATESVAIAQTLALIELTGTRVHFCRLSTKESIRLLRQAKQDGLPVTADVAAHQLFLTEHDLEDYNPLCHVRPPLRSEDDRQALLEGLEDDTIDAICSDHQPHEVDAKLAPFQGTQPGISALETLLPLVGCLVQQGVLTPLKALRKVSFQPAEIMQTGTGRLQPGAPADLVLFDPTVAWSLSLENMLSHGRNTPFAGYHFQGQVTRTFLSGRSVFSRD